MRWQHLLHAKCFKVSILQFKTSVYFFLWKFQMQCSRPQVNFYSSLHLSILRRVLVNFCSFLPSPHPPTFFFFGPTTSFIFSISCCPLFSITWEKRSKLYGETRNGRSESGKRKMQRVIERHARRRRFNNLNFFFFECFDLNRENHERFLDPSSSTVVRTVSCFLCIEQFLGLKELDWWEDHG